MTSSCLRIPVKVVAIFDIILTVLSIIIILAIIRDVYNLTPPFKMGESIKTESFMEQRERERDDAWMTNQTLTFEERSKLMAEEHEKWRHKVHESHQKESTSFKSNIFSGLLFLILWVLFAILLLIIECVVVFMGIRLYLSMNKAAHRNDVRRTLQFWIVISIIFITLFVVDVLMRHAHPTDSLFLLGLTNIGFRTAAILLVSLYFCQVVKDKFPGDTDFYMVNQTTGNYGDQNSQIPPEMGQIIQPGSYLYGQQQSPHISMNAGRPGGGGWVTPSAPIMSLGKFN